MQILFWRSIKKPNQKNKAVVLQAIEGESAFDKETLNELLSESKVSIEEFERIVEMLKEELPRRFSAV